MARIRVESDDEELPSLTDLLKSTKFFDPKPKKCSSSSSKSSERRTPSPNNSKELSPRKKSNDVDTANIQVKSKARPQQRALKRVDNNSVLLQPLKVSADISSLDKKERREQLVSRVAAKLSCIGESEATNALSKSDIVSKFTTPDEAEESEGASSADTENCFKPRPKVSPRQVLPPSETSRAIRQNGRSFRLPPTLGELQKFEVPKSISESIHSRPTTSSSNDNAALLTYEPPRRISPHKAPPIRPSTPPQSPTKSRLTSPTKGKAVRIPTPPHKPDLEAFWSQDVINDWNDQYSPRKPITSPRKQKFIALGDSHDDGYASPSASPRKGSPIKKDKKAIDAKKAFESTKHRAAEDFLAELDAKITNGKIADLAASAGGVKIIWSKKLNSTAGRANWKRETTRIKLANGTISKTYKHYANIELAEKVIDDEERLINVLAHEFCHLANFMVSGVKDNPHGKEFKIWAKKTSTAFSHRGVEVTTKHSYVIDYKYIWECVSCGYEFKRHSKSIDPLRHTCGSCKSKLVQTKPAVRANAKVSDYQLFVKEHFQRVKRDNLGVSHGNVMEVLGREYREQKSRSNTAIQKQSTSSGKEMDEMVRELEIITLDD